METWDKVRWAVRSVPMEKPVARSVLTMLVSYANDLGYCYPSQTTLANHLYGEAKPHQVKQVRKAVKYLEDRGLVEVKRNARVVHGVAVNTYTLTFTDPGLSPTPVDQAPRSVSASDPGLSVTSTPVCESPRPRSVRDPQTPNGTPSQLPLSTPTSRFRRGMPPIQNQGEESESAQTPTYGPQDSGAPGLTMATMEGNCIKCKGRVPAYEGLRYVKPVDGTWGLQHEPGDCRPLRTTTNTTVKPRPTDTFEFDPIDMTTALAAFEEQSV